MSEIEDELRQAFLEDASQLLLDAEAGVLRLDAGDQTDETIGAIFRLAHSFKGSAAIVGLSGLTGVSHELEEVLSLIRKRALSPDRAVCTTIFATLDAIKRAVEEIRQDPTRRASFTRVIEQMRSLRSQGVPGETPPGTPPPGVPRLPEPGSPAPPSIAQNAGPPEPARTALPPGTESPGSEQGATLRVSLKRLDRILNLVGELVVTQRTLSTARGTDGNQQARGYMDQLVRETQLVALSLRLVPVRPVLQRLQRLVRDTAADLRKEVRLVTIGEQSEIDKSILDQLGDPLSHLLRNAIDHGIEPPEVRKARNKAPRATVSVEVYQHEERVLIQVADDGCGLDRQRILARAVSRGIVAPDARLSEAEIYGLIFEPGFSTKDEVTEISGRGVGLDIVQRTIVDLKGTLDLETTPGKGTTFKISLPLSLSMIAGLVVKVDGQCFVLPVTQLEETLDLGQLSQRSVPGKKQLLEVRGEVVPVFHLGCLLQGVERSAESAPRPTRRPAVVISHRGRRVVLLVDAILGQQEIVVKRLARNLVPVPGITAGAILDGGEPGLVLNLQELLNAESAHVLNS